LEEQLYIDGDVEADVVITTNQECLEQILAAFRDIAERDDIHQAALRLNLVQAWINREAAKAADDPVFRELELAP